MSKIILGRIKAISSYTLEEGQKTNFWTHDEHSLPI